jgi:hypothetical protein
METEVDGILFLARQSIDDGQITEQIRPCR